MLFVVDAVLLCFATQSLRIAVEWLHQGVSKGTGSPVMSCDCIVFCELLLADRIGTATSSDANLLGFARKKCVFFGYKRRLRCGAQLLEKSCLACATGLGVVALAWNQSRSASAM